MYYIKENPAEGSRDDWSWLPCGDITEQCGVCWTELDILDYQPRYGCAVCFHLLVIPLSCSDGYEIYLRFQSYSIDEGASEYIKYEVALSCDVLDGGVL